MKEEMLKKKGSILKILDVDDKKKASEVIVGEEKRQHLIDSQINDVITDNLHPRNLPFKWDPL